MTGLVATMIGALIAAVALNIASGPALRAVRSRRALRELLEIRTALEASDSARIDKVNAALDEEFDLLVRLGDTSRRYVMAQLTALAVLGAVAWISLFAPHLLIQDGHKELARYISAGALLLACVLLSPISRPRYAAALPGWTAVVRPAHGWATSATPAWMSAVDSFTASKAFGLGFALKVVTPKNLLLVLAAGTTIAQATSARGEQLVALAFC